MIKIEVAFATSELQKIIQLEVENKITAQEAVLRSEIIKFFPEIDLDNLDLGIFSRPCSLDEILEEGDRVEIYRPLKADPKIVRRERAKKYH